MAPQQKGKQGTKGQKQIVEENIATLSFYRNIALGATGAFALVTGIFFEIFTTSNIIFFLIASGIYTGCYMFMGMMARATFTESGQLIDSGLDLNMQDGVAEHVKDLVILTAFCQVFSLFSNYSWLFWLLAPARALWLLWGSVIQPWLTSSNEQQQPEMDEKKQKKLDRKMRRMQ
ncbi:transmembrane protein 208 [Neocloeon triangulifer]|uniref:transmembrane protein 208 n=1 Tax=Neocloeon triangulifer TaxID=2078957 RepID=UPI00286EF290|nr:transmembrane protein 208 [Neocloeon triangulifer]